MRYPLQALRARQQGKVLIGFTIDSTGRNTNIHVQQGAYPALDEEALRLGRRLERVRWQPGTQNGRPVPVTMTAGINFYLQDQQGRPVPLSDSLDQHPGPTLVLPLLEWSTFRDAIPADRGVIYGTCLQRLGYNSGGLGQYVRLVNLTTGKEFRLNIKPAFRSRLENSFCYALPPGRYALVNYEYSVSKWYGAELHVESLRKATDVAAPLAATRYMFEVQPGQLHYVGTWNFSQAADGPQFIREKSALDEWLASKYKKLDAAHALLAIPQ